MIQVSAVYENGVLRPTGPLDLPDGQQVSVAITPAQSGADWE